MRFFSWLSSNKGIAMPDESSLLLQQQQRADAVAISVLPDVNSTVQEQKTWDEEVQAIRKLVPADIMGVVVALMPKENLDMDAQLGMLFLKSTTDSYDSEEIKEAREQVVESPFYKIQTFLFSLIRSYPEWVNNQAVYISSGPLKGVTLRGIQLRDRGANPVIDISGRDYSAFRDSLVKAFLVDRIFWHPSFRLLICNVLPILVLAAVWLCFALRERATLFCDFGGLNASSPLLRPDQPCPNNTALYTCDMIANYSDLWRENAWDKYCGPQNTWCPSGSMDNSEWYLLVTSTFYASCADSNVGAFVAGLALTLIGVLWGLFEGVRFSSVFCSPEVQFNIDDKIRRSWSLYNVHHTLKIFCGKGRFVDSLSGDHREYYFRKFDACPSMFASKRLEEIKKMPLPTDSSFRLS